MDRSQRKFDHLEDMSGDHIDAQPIAYDWQRDRDTTDKDPDERAWSWAETVECPRCGREVVAVNGCMVEHTTTEGYINSDADEEIEPEQCEASGDYHDSAEGPMMSYWYPCNWATMETAAWDIGALPLCAVEVDGVKGLALTGGGMDLSWDICEAYMRLGYLPPAHYAGDLPNMGGRLDAVRLAIFAACERSLEITILRAQRGIERLRDHRRALSRNAAGITPDMEDSAIDPAERLLAYALADVASEDDDQIDACADFGGKGLLKEVK